MKKNNFPINDTVTGTTVRQSKWVDWNRYVDELSYAQAFRQELVRDGFDSGIGMLVDTSRNGWGGGRRPRRGPKGPPRRRHRRLRVDQAPGRVGRRQQGDPERRGQGLRPDVRP